MLAKDPNQRPEAVEVALRLEKIARGREGRRVFQGGRGHRGTLGLERLHLEGTGTIRIDNRRPADAILPHQRRQSRDERR